MLQVIWIHKGAIGAYRTFLRGSEVAETQAGLDSAGDKTTDAVRLTVAIFDGVDYSAVHVLSVETVEAVEITSMTRTRAVPAQG